MYDVLELAREEERNFRIKRRDHIYSQRQKRLVRQEACYYWRDYKEPSDPPTPIATTVTTVAEIHEVPASLSVEDRSPKKENNQIRSSKNTPSPTVAPLPSPAFDLSPNYDSIISYKDIITPYVSSQDDVNVFASTSSGTKMRSRYRSQVRQIKEDGMTMYDVLELAREEERNFRIKRRDHIYSQRQKRLVRQEACYYWRDYKEPSAPPTPIATTVTTVAEIHEVPASLSVEDRSPKKENNQIRSSKNTPSPTVAPLPSPAFDLSPNYDSIISYKDIITPYVPSQDDVNVFPSTSSGTKMRSRYRSQVRQIKEDGMTMYDVLELAREEERNFRIKRRDHIYSQRQKRLVRQEACYYWRDYKEPSAPPTPIATTVTTVAEIHEVPASLSVEDRSPKKENNQIRSSKNTPSPTVAPLPSPAFDLSPNYDSIISYKDIITPYVPSQDDVNVFASTSSGTKMRSRYRSQVRQIKEDGMTMYDVLELAREEERNFRIKRRDHIYSQRQKRLVRQEACYYWRDYKEPSASPTPIATTVTTVAEIHEVPASLSVEDRSPKKENNQIRSSKNTPSPTVAPLPSPAFDLSPNYDSIISYKDIITPYVPSQVSAITKSTSRRKMSKRSMQIHQIEQGMVKLSNRLLARMREAWAMAIGCIMWYTKPHKVESTTTPELEGESWSELTSYNEDIPTTGALWV